MESVMLSVIYVLALVPALVLAIALLAHLRSRSALDPSAIAYSVVGLISQAWLLTAMFVRPEFAGAPYSLARVVIAGSNALTLLVIAICSARAPVERGLKRSAAAHFASCALWIFVLFVGFVV